MEKITRNNGDCYCLNCLHSIRTKNKLESHKKVFENKGFCNVIMISEDTKILEFNQDEKSDHRGIENKHDIYRGKDCMKKFCGSLREHAMKIINFKKKK